MATNQGQVAYEAYGRQSVTAPGNASTPRLVSWGDLSHVVRAMWEIAADAAMDTAIDRQREGLD